MPQSAIRQLVEDLAALPGSDRLYNLYAPSEDPAAATRRANLARYLRDMQDYEPHVLLVAEAPGYRGCRYTGIPVTSERIMLEGIERWDLFGAGYQPTSDHPDGMAEMSATILWGALADNLSLPPVIWNTVPLHPHKRGNPDSNRTPTVKELRMGAPFIKRVIALYEFSTVLAVGRKAERMLGELDIAGTYVRHPSQGGKADFIAGLKAHA